jgi:hypothetical protein
MDLIGRRVRVQKQKCITVGNWQDLPPYEATIAMIQATSRDGCWAFLLVCDNGDLTYEYLGSTSTRRIELIPMQTAIQRTPTAKKPPEFGGHLKEQGG